MLVRSMMLMFAAGCVGTGDAPGAPAATVAEIGTVNFQCLLNAGDLHVVSCQGSISLFPITITIEHLHILSNNELSILSDDLNDLADVDGSVQDHNEILDDVELLVLDDFLDKFDSNVTNSDILACTAVLGVQHCK